VELLLGVHATGGEAPHLTAHAVHAAALTAHQATDCNSKGKPPISYENVNSFFQN
jgi:hypothetical protein